jgi:hypothetical protein
MSTPKIDIEIKNGVCFLTPEGSTQSHRLGALGQVKGAMNAWFELQAGDRYLYHEPGLHLTVDPTKLPMMAEQAGYVSQEYAGSLVKPGSGWCRLYVEGFQLVVGRHMQLLQSEIGEADWKTANRRAIRKMTAMDLLCRGYKLILVPSMQNAEGEFSIPAAEKYFQTIIDTAALPIEEARKLIAEKIEIKRAFKEDYRLAASPERAERLSAGVETLKLLDGSDVAVSSLVGKRVRRFVGATPIREPIEVTSETLPAFVASVRQYNMRVEIQN